MNCPILNSQCSLEISTCLLTSGDSNLEKDKSDSKDEEQQGFFEIPEVIENILKFFENIRDLTNVRLVNQIFNVEACRFIRKKCVVYIHEYNNKTRLVDLKSLLSKSRETGSPIPFHCYILEVGKFEDESLVHIIDDERLYPKKIILHRPPHHDNNSFQLNLHQLLLNKASHVQSIHFTLTDGINFGTCPSTQFCFPSLVKIRISGSWENENNVRDETLNKILNCAQFLIKIVNCAPKLEKIVSSFADERIFIQILEQANFKNISHFSASSLTPLVFEKLVTLTLPKLKTLHALIEPDFIQEEFVASSVTHDLVKHFSATIDDLLISWNFNSANDSFPTCKKLKNLAIKYWSGSLSAFNMENLPSLKRLHVFDFNQFGDGQLKAHHGVETFAFECMKGTGVRFGLYTERDFSSVLDSVKLQFPNLICLDLKIALTTKAMRSIFKKFPNLKSLILDADSEYDESIFTGISRLNMDEILAGKKRLEDISRLASFQDLKSLENLVLSRSYEYRFPKDADVVTDRIVKFGISKIRNLKVLQIDWAKDLSVEILCDNLNHLAKFIINYSEDFLENLEPFEILKTFMGRQVILQPTKNHNEHTITGPRGRNFHRRPAQRRRRNAASFH